MKIREANEVMRRAEQIAGRPTRPASSGQGSIASVGGRYTNTLSRDSKRVVERLNASYHECACVEMEASGFLAAVDRYRELYNPAARGHVIKGISDYASNKDSDETVRGNASANAANVAIRLAEWMATSTEVEFLKGEIYRERV